jgi:hypothetical protein
MNLSIGILAIGSLFWDPKTDALHPREIGIREGWWKSRLDKGAARSVRVPIRYGRLSSKRGDTYSMVFSAEQAASGCAKVIPCLNFVGSEQDLKSEAEHLWAAERSVGTPDTSLSSKWGAVGLLTNWERNSEARHVLDLKEIERSWSVLINQNAVNRRNYQTVATSNACISESGLLEIAWPESTDGRALELDLILATANSPTLVGSPLNYPDTTRIANAWLRARREHPLQNYENYFWKNVTNGITTLQDEEIMRRLNAEK